MTEAPADSELRAELVITQMNDPEFLDARRRVRDELTARPSAELTARYAALNDEFDRRASAAWKGQA